MKLKYIFLYSIFFLLSCGRKKDEIHPVRKDVTETVFASGTLEPENKYNLTAQADGYLLELKFDLGDTVKAGQVLAIIDNKPNSISASGAGQILSLARSNAAPDGPTLMQAMQNTELMKSKSEEDSIQFIRYKKLFQTSSVSRLELENAELLSKTSKTNYLNALQNYRLMKQQTEQQLINQETQSGLNNVNKDNNEIKAVLPGRVYKKLKEVGDFVRRGDVLAVIGEPSDLYAKISIDENNISKIKLNQEVEIQLNIDKTKNYKGFVSEIFPAFDEANQSFYCKVKFKTVPEIRIASTQLQANVITSNKKNILVIPKTFLGYGNKVMVKDKGETPVETGFISTEWVEVLKGLDENSIVVSDQIK